MNTNLIEIVNYGLNKNTDSILNSNFLLSYNISYTQKDKKKKKIKMRNMTNLAYYACSGVSSGTGSSIIVCTAAELGDGVIMKFDLLSSTFTALAFLPEASKGVSLRQKGDVRNFFKNRNILGENANRCLIVFYVVLYEWYHVSWWVVLFFHVVCIRFLGMFGEAFMSLTCCCT
ncbi:hypothetical protein AGLY_007835 [Aphis glycines]|uniref:Uncharacterized protein n=1 Tax=Aphis glycines TaxID=307491 RepID=A0A6G0TP14_APHGL|nr:hypothetical protein AGLY_007835 [Aphis glycines]